MKRRPKPWESSKPVMAVTLTRAKKALKKAMDTMGFEEVAP